MLGKIKILVKIEISVQIFGPNLEKNRIRHSVPSSKKSKNIIFKELEIINFQLKLVNVDNKLAKKICRNLSRNHQITNSKMFFL